MNAPSERHLKTGGDPRLLPDYAALREELGKLTHPARPDVDWRRVEQLSLSLFERNGVELQTAVWYTQARLRLLGLPGLNKGLAILAALLAHQWSSLWPQPVHARMEILSSFSQRVQQTLRTLSLRYADLGALYQAEQHLAAIIAVLARLELKHMSQLDALRAQLQQAAARLESKAGDSGALAADAVTTQGDAPPDDARRVYVATAPALPEVSRHGVKTARWKPFIAGMLTMLVAGGGALLGWQACERPDPLAAQVAASLDAWPQVASSAALAPEHARELTAQSVIELTRQRLGWLSRLPPDRNIRYGGELVRQVDALWPQNPQALALFWRQQIRAAAMPLQNLDDWQQGMTQLDQLAARLNALDERRGRYLTGSELKTMVFAIRQAFDATPPAEELLRRMAAQRQQGAVPEALRVEAESRLNQLLWRYVLLTPETMTPDASGKTMP
ncbi:VasL domain-containing protein [Cronobacter dublinensis]